MHGGPSDASRAAGSVVLLVKDFATAKARLAPALDPSARAALAERLALGVLRAAEAIPGRRRTIVVGDTARVVAWAEGLGAFGLLQRDSGLDAAAREGMAEAADGDWTVVAHADLAEPDGLAGIVEAWAPDRAVIVPDRHGDGTNVIVLPSGAPLAFAYGAGSFARHRAACANLGLEVRVIVDSTLTHDVDAPEDLRDGIDPGQ